MEFVQSGVFTGPLKWKRERKINLDPRLSRVSDKHRESNTAALQEKMAAARGLNDATSPSDRAKNLKNGSKKCSF